MFTEKQIADSRRQVNDMLSRGQATGAMRRQAQQLRGYATNGVALSDAQKDFLARIDAIEAAEKR